ncbi:MAG: hypothetical protein QOG56_286 [Solirubrobacteraceae bacterium]|nr:hypothetical protein [Solirubrobacteraceae bacterium]
MQKRLSSDRPPGSRRAGRTGAALALFALALSGCMSLKENKIVQTTPGKVTIRTVLCASNYAKVSGLPDCNKDSVFEIHNNTADATAAKDGQLLVGFRVALGANGPDSFQSKDGVAVFTKSPTYTGELRRLLPPAAGQQWIGYISNFGHYDPAGLRILELEPDFTLPAAGSSAPLQWRTVVGFREGNPAAPNPNAAVSCSDDLVNVNPCLESPPLDRARVDLTQPVSDFAVLGGATTTAFAGTTAVLPFKLRYSDGAKLGRRSFSLSARTQLPQLSAKTAPTLSLDSDATSDTTVQVQLPAGAPAGRFAVALTAAIGSPPVERAAAGTIEVVAVPQVGSKPPLPASGNVDFGFVTPRSGAGRKVTRMAVTGVPAGGTVRVTCRGGGCAFKTKAIKGRRTVNLAKTFRSRTLRPRTVVRLAITGPNRIAKEFTFTIRSGPRKVLVASRCRPPAAKTALRCAPSGS